MEKPTCICCGGEPLPTDKLCEFCREEMDLFYQEFIRNPGINRTFISCKLRAARSMEQ